jgi:hypothetical protein
MNDELIALAERLSKANDNLSELVGALEKRFPLMAKFPEGGLLEEAAAMLRKMADSKPVGFVTGYHMTTGVHYKDLTLDIQRYSAAKYEPKVGQDIFAAPVAADPEFLAEARLLLKEVREEAVHQSSVREEYQDSGDLFGALAALQAHLEGKR